MIRKWEKDFQKIQKQWAKNCEAQEKTAVCGQSNKKVVSFKPLKPSDYFGHQDSLCCQENLCTALLLGTWHKFPKLDPLIAAGKHSPLEKEMLHLGGVHTVASRRFMNQKEEEERRLLRELKQLSPDYKLASDYRRQLPHPASPGLAPEKTWEAKVILPPEEFIMPEREKFTISKHLERMRLARNLRNQQFLPYVEKFPSVSSLSRGTLSTRVEADRTRKCQEEDEVAAHESEDKDKTTHRRTVTIDVIFKSEERKSRLQCCQQYQEPFLPRKKPERSITGLTNRNMLSVDEFPGDLLLLHQEFLSREVGLRPGKTHRVLGPGLWRDSQHQATSHQY